MCAEGAGEQFVEDGLGHLSVLADSLALGRPESFSSHCSWMAGFLERRGLPHDYLEEMLAVLGDGVATDEALSTELAAPCLATLEAGRHALSSPAVSA